MEIQSVDVDIDEVECMIANMIYKVSERIPSYRAI